METACFQVHSWSLGSRCSCICRTWSGAQLLALKGIHISQHSLGTTTSWPAQPKCQGHGYPSLGMLCFLSLKRSSISQSRAPFCCAVQMCIHVHVCIAHITCSSDVTACLYFLAYYIYFFRQYFVVNNPATKYVVVVLLLGSKH